MRCSTPSELWSWVTGRPAPGATPARPAPHGHAPRPGSPRPRSERRPDGTPSRVPSLATPDPRTGRRREEPQPVRNITASAHLSNMRPSHGAMGLRWRMAMRCYVIGYSVRLERALHALRAALEHDRMAAGGCASPCPGLSRVAVSKLVSKHRLSYYCDIYAPDVPVDAVGCSLRR